ncbi:Neurofilament protein H, form H2 [Pleurostoma richardsiae]|uniref:Neurofilament protein H, form H2 n=1 Tax=Pleurostoma richardsiae TaxID=41990 RepID=A0AA38SG42_9PEZI|nr:Neurofilament protein H, form H2 [Pleurostoma richardsiae]
MASSSDQPKSYSTDPALYIYTSLTAGSSHIVTATSRLETILRANRVPFKAIDIATDEKARMLWGRRAGKDESGRLRKLPGLVQMGLVLGDLVEIEEWNEYGELKQHVTIYYDEFTQPALGQAPPPMQLKKPATASAAAAPTAAAATTTPPPAPAAPPLPAEKDASKEGEKKTATAKAADAAAKVTVPIRSIAEEAAAKAKQVRLQSLRDKVYGKGGSKEDDKAGPGEGEAAAKDEEEAKKTEQAAEEQLAAPAGGQDAESESTSGPSFDRRRASWASVSSGHRAAGLQSPTTGAWGGSAADGDLLRALQSPTSTSWRPVDVDAPVTSYRGAAVAMASQEEIESVEKAEAILEEPDEEEREAEEDEKEAEEKAEEKAEEDEKKE